MLAAWAEKLDYLAEEIRRRDQELKRLRVKIAEQADIIAQFHRGEQELEQRQREQETSSAALSSMDRNHYGDHAYWTARRLYVLRRTTGLSYREIAEQTGIPKSTVQRRVKQHQE